MFNVTYGVGSLLAGFLVDRFGPRRVILVGCLLLPIALAASAAITTLWHLYFTVSLLSGLGVSFVAYVPVAALLTATFEERRGLPLGIASAGVGVGILAMLPLTQVVIDSAGWRAGYLAMAGMVAVVMLPLGFFIQRGETIQPPASARPPSGTELSAKVSKSITDWTLASALRNQEFWLIMCTFTLLNGPVQLILTHQVAHLVEVGHPKILVVGIVGLVGLVSVPGKILWGFLSDRWWLELIYLAGIGCMVAAMFLLLWMTPASPVWGLYLYAILMGMGYAVSPAMTPIVSGRFFAGSHFGVIFGALNMVYHSGGAAGIWLAGYAHDVTASYRLPLLGSILSATLAACCAWLIAPRRIPPR